MVNRIAIHNSLRDLSQGLSRLGYDVQEFEQHYRGNVDAIIYSNNQRTEEIPMVNGAIHSITSQFDTPQLTGALIINGDNKTPDQIDYMIKHRVYSPLF